MKGLGRVQNTVVRFSVRVTTLPLSGIYRSPAAALDWAFAWPLTGIILDGLDLASLAALRSEALAEIERTADLTWRYTVNYFKSQVPTVLFLGFGICFLGIF